MGGVSAMNLLLEARTLLANAEPNGKFLPLESQQQEWAKRFGAWWAASAPDIMKKMTLRQWLIKTGYMNKHAAALGRLGGKAKSEAKAAASRANGRKGGRPRNKPKRNQRTAL